MLPTADVLYACDAQWWRISGPQSCEAFPGARYSTHNTLPKKNDDKSGVAEDYRLRLLEADGLDGFSFEIGRLSYGLGGESSGFQAVNLALQFGARRVYLLGFDYRIRDGQRHFFGDHPVGLVNPDSYDHMRAPFENAARMLPPGIRIVNCSPASALQCFERGEI